MSLGLLIAIGLVVAFVWTQVHAYLGSRAEFAACAGRVHSVPPERWHGGNAPPLRMGRGCP